MTSKVRAYAERIRAADAERDRIEDDRRISLMRDHLNEPGTTSVCLCGFGGYSTPGYLLHVYDVIADDAWGDNE